jgi:UDP-N-acetylmuramoyl-tripeptide--D-alanyl-D-alanine ligase
VAEAHVEQLRDVHGVAIEKASLLKHLRRGGLAVVNIDREALRQCVLSDEDAIDAARGGKPSLLTYGTCEQADLRMTSWRQDGDRLRLEINGRIALNLPATGRHNALNAVAAFAVARRLGMTEEQIAERFESYTPPAMRVERTRVGRLDIINDAYNANPGSMEAALDVLRAAGSPGRRVLVVGDMAELGDRSEYWHAWLGRQAVGMPLGLLVAIGEQAETVVSAAREALRDNGRSRRGRPKLVAYATTNEAVAEVPGLLKRDDQVLIKGSRAVALERVVEAVIQWAERAATESPGPSTTPKPTRKRAPARTRVKASP